MESVFVVFVPSGQSEPAELYGVFSSHEKAQRFVAENCPHYDRDGTPWWKILGVPVDRRVSRPVSDWPDRYPEDVILL